MSTEKELVDQTLIAASSLKADISACKVCTDLPQGIRPVVQFSSASKILLVGQAPGRKVHETGIPFDDASGDRLREWLGVSREVFYDDQQIAIVPMGFCYPGTGKHGDFPPRTECVATWRERVLSRLAQVQLTVVIGRYALDYHLPTEKALSVTDAVKQWAHHWPNHIPLPHPSPRNNRWLKNNPWFSEEVISQLQARVKDVLSPQ
ncbi:uracil-DNA glycosylase family protein [Eionea flava]